MNTSVQASVLVGCVVFEPDSSISIISSIILVCSISRGSHRVISVVVVAVIVMILIGIIIISRSCRRNTSRSPSCR